MNKKWVCPYCCEAYITDHDADRHLKECGDQAYYALSSTYSSADAKLDRIIELLEQVSRKLGGWSR